MSYAYYNTKTQPKAKSQKPKANAKAKTQKPKPKAKSQMPSHKPIRDESSKMQRIAYKSEILAPKCSK